MDRAARRRGNFGASALSSRHERHEAHPRRRGRSCRSPRRSRRECVHQRDRARDRADQRHACRTGRDRGARARERSPGVGRGAGEAAVPQHPELRREGPAARAPRGASLCPRGRAVRREDRRGRGLGGLGQLRMGAFDAGGPRVVDAEQPRQASRARGGPDRAAAQPRRGRARHREPRRSRSPGEPVCVPRARARPPGRG